MSAGPWQPPPILDGMVTVLWRMLAIAAVWFGMLALVMVLTEPGPSPARPVQAAAAEPPSAPAEPPRTRSLRHGGSVGAPVPAP